VVSIDSNGVIAIGGLAGAANLLTEARQLLTSNGTKSVALDVRTTGQVLTTNSSAANGIEWANLPAATSTTPGVVYGTYVENSTPDLYNIGYGPSALNPGVTGLQNISVGNGALSAVTTSSANMAVGANCLESCTKGSYNNTLGPGALQNLTTSRNNIGIGSESGYNVTTGSGNICIGNQAGEGVTTTSNNIIIGTSANIGSDTVADSIVLGANAVCSNSNECYLAGIDHLNIPALTTSADGTGILMQYGGADVGWVQASGGTYNSVSKIDSAISAIKNNYIIFNSSGGVTSYTIPSGINIVNIEAAGGGAAGNGVTYYGQNTGGEDIYDRGGEGGLGQFGNITIPVTAGSIRIYFWSWRSE